jgi:CxxC motif-containing protein (DUF1111 family)
MPREMRMRTVVLMAATGVLALLFAQWRINSQTLSAADSENLTNPLPGLTAQEEDDFTAGLEDFLEVETVADGLGPVFNGKSCAECHAVPSVGGSEPNVGVARETRIGRLFKGGFDPLDGSVSESVNRGGGLLQQRAINVPGCHLKGEVVPPEATFVSLRISTPLFGAGLMEAIPQKTIEDNALIPGNGGRPNYVFNPDSGLRELGRFGWKAQVATLHQFAGDAYLNEMGITNPSFPDEKLPQGQPIPSGCDPAADPEDDGSGVTAFTNFMRFLAPAPRRPVTDQVQQGEQVFREIGCTSCHVPTMMTGPNPVAALSNKPVNLFSDLLLHDIGTGDGIEQGEAKGSEFRTAPLWGLSRRNRFMHDGGSKTIEQAILRHGVDAQKAVSGFLGLSPSDHDALLAFLGSL